jgi:hypothetical protein
MGRQQCDGYISLTIGLKCMHFNPEDRGRTASETVSNHHTTWHSNLEDQKFYLHRRENLESHTRVHPKVSGLSHNEINAYKNKHSLRSNTKGYGGKIH